MGFGKAEFPRQAGMFDGSLWRSTSATVESRDQHHVSVGFGHTRGDGSNADFADEFDANACGTVGVFQVVNELSKVLDRVNVMVWRRGNESHTWCRVTGFGDPRINFSTRKLATFTGLGTLCELDLQFAGLGEIEAGHAETTGCDLLDRTVFRIATVVGPSEAFGVLTTFAGVGFPADAVHRDGQGLVGLARNRSVAHGSGFETLEDILDRLNFFDRHGSALLKVKKPAQREMLFGLLIDQVRVGLEGIVVARAHGTLQRVNDLRAEQVSLAFGAPLVFAADFQGFSVA